ncbi:hypothetical protein SY83_07810 [Paenibacillus swuensis]|uniref:CopC domain-containing protein n=2 Tax=Paenibacillus swuensis TaxID=1178515 RepID=A0A172TPP6_9BACL|nr:hypothetical protein SY83_07810 [Paenibacillus swuensis]
MSRSLRTAAGVLALVAVLFTALGVFMPGTADAHAQMVQAVPAADSRLETGPSSVTLKFNEAIEEQLYNINVLNAKGAKLGSAGARVTENGTVLRLELKQKPGEGVYTVSYSVISADGHPVEGAYVFTVGDPPATEDVPKFPIEGHELHEGDHAGHVNQQVSWDMDLQQYVQFAVRIAYYIALLILSGWVLWNAVLPIGSQDLQTSLKDGMLLAQRAQLLLLLLYIFVHAWNLVGQQGLNQWSRLFTQTDVGLSWMVSLVWSFVGFVILGRNRMMDIVWVMVLLSAKAMTGHAAGFDPQWLTVSLNYAHLLASAVWVGGVTLLLVQWRKLGEVKEAYVSAVSRGALWSIVALIATGILSTFVFLPRIDYLLYTQWGEFLILKTVLVLTVLVVGAYLRNRIKKGKALSELLKLDAGLMAAILVIVGIFTYISPLPANEPLYFHEMGETQHGTVRISPNVPGVNTFTVKVFLPENRGEPKQVLLRMHPLDRPETGAITVPVKAFKDEDFDAFTGFEKYAYKVEGPYLPFAGKWLVELRVLDPEDNEKVYKTEMRIY